MKILVTAGPTYEPIDPVRFIGNRSSGKQGYAIAESLAANGHDVTLISGPSSLPDPKGVNTIRIETARDMLAATQSALPADIAIFAAAVSDWRIDTRSDQKIKKTAEGTPPTFTFIENPDILKTIAHADNRPALVIGFAAETENLEENARAKRIRKNCDWIIANLVGQKDKQVFGEDQNQVYCIDEHSIEEWPEMSKTAIADKLAAAIDAHFETLNTQDAAE